MYMKKVIYLLSIILSVVMIGCKDDTVKVSEQAQDIENVVTENFLFSGENNYSKILRTDAPMIGYSTIKENSLASNELRIIDDVNDISNSEFNLQKSPSASSFTLLVNGINLSEMDNQIVDGMQKAKASQNLLYGQNVSFTISRRFKSMSSVNGLQRVSSQDTTLTMYVPNLVEVTSPKIEKTSDLFPYCYYKDFELKWNADSKNDNGLVVIVEWTGMNIKGEKTAKYIRNIDIISNDNGSAVLNEKLFDNIPENAIAYITLLRGSISMVEDYLANEGQGQSYRVVAESHAVLPLILVRNL